MPDSQLTDEQRAIIREVLQGAIPVNSASKGDYITRHEMESALVQLETRLDIRLENSMLKIRNWVITGMLAGALLFGGGFITTIVKIDRVAEAMPSIAASLEARRQWIAAKDQQDMLQDSQLRKLDKSYTPTQLKPPPL